MPTLRKQLADLVSNIRSGNDALVEHRRSICKECEHHRVTERGGLRCEYCGCADPAATRPACPAGKWGTDSPPTDTRPIFPGKITICINALDEGPRVRAMVNNFRENLAGNDFEFVVVDDASTDGCCADLGAQVTVIRNVERIGCGRSKCRAVEAATGDVLMFYDAHHAVTKGYLAEVAIEAAKARQIVCPITTCVDYTQDWQPYLKRDEVNAPSREQLSLGRKLYTDISSEQRSQRIFDSNGGVGVGLAVSRETLGALGGWNSFEGVHGSQERGMALRAWFADVPVRILTAVHVGHWFCSTWSEKYPPGQKKARPPLAKDHLRNLWYAFFVVLNPDTFSRHFRPKLLEQKDGARGQDTEQNPDAIRQRDHFLKHCKRRTDAEYLQMIGMAESRIEVAIPYAPGKQLGAAYNRIMAKADDWVLLLDHDVLLLNPNWYDICRDAIDSAGDRVGIFSCRTNDIACPDQLLVSAPAGHDIEAHRDAARDVWIRHGRSITEITNGKMLISGFFMLVRKAAWEKVGGFKAGMMGVDNDFHKRVAKAGYQVWRIDGLYCYHRRERQDRDWSHLSGIPKKRVIYTVITGGYNKLRPAPDWPGWDFVCFTDAAVIKAAGWQIRFLDAENLDAAKLSRRPKILAHEYLPEYDYSVYVDGKFEMLFDPIEMGMRAGWPDFATARHPRFKNIQRELRECVQLGKVDEAAAAAQVAGYEAAGLPPEHGLTDNGVLLRRHKSPQVRQLDEAWWAEVERHTHRDQLSLPYARQRTRVQTATFSIAERDRFFRLHPNKLRLLPKNSADSIAAQCRVRSSQAEELRAKADQHPREIAAAAEAVAQIRPKTFLELGSKCGGSLYVYAGMCLPNATVIAVDDGARGINKRISLRRIIKTLRIEGFDAYWIQGNARDDATKASIQQILSGRMVDFLHIDGDHQEAAVHADWENFRPLLGKGALAAFHDIRAITTGVPTAWRAISKQATAEGEIIREIYSPKQKRPMGIGLIWIGAQDTGGKDE